jgi:two-component system, NarL family, response regulator NreC
MSQQTDRRIRVLLMDDHAIVREGLQLLLRRHHDIQVVGDTGMVEEALAFANPVDVIVADLLMPEHRGPRLVEALRERHPDSRILVLTMVDNPADVHLSLVAGANGYLLKEAAASELVDAIRRVAAGEEYLQPSLGAVLTRATEEAQAEGRSLEILTLRERDVVRLVALGYTNAEAGALLGIAQRTVESHRTHVLRKLGIRSRAELVRFAVEFGIVQLWASAGSIDAEPVFIDS